VEDGHGGLRQIQVPVLEKKQSLIGVTQQIFTRIFTAESISRWNRLCQLTIGFDMAFRRAIQHFPCPRLPLSMGARRARSVLIHHLCFGLLDFIVLA
jgi:hypothetical protein